MQRKLNQIISNWQKGTVRTSNSLRTDGYSDDLLSKYVKSKWLESFGFGAYKLYGNSIHWFGAIHALQTELNSTIHVAGKSALQINGLAHKWDTTLTITQTTKCGNYSHFLTDIVLDSITLKVSSPELAIMEMLLKVPDGESYNEANLIMEGLLTLRPKVVSKLLLECKSVKTKRLFLHLAEKQNHTWFRRLDLAKVNLGSGKRQIIKNGRLDSKYLITVPRE